jgi:polyvinyl alcohol dehydrogenase (cytochrome)
MKPRGFVRGFVAYLAISVLGLSAQAQAPIALFEQRCATCHAAGDDRTPSREALRQRTPEAILDALMIGSMQPNAVGLTDAQKRALAEYIAGHPLGALVSGDASAMKNRCEPKSFSDPAKAPMWNGWGVDLANSRFQPAAAAQLPPDRVRNLKLKWAFGFASGSSAFGQPAIVGGHVFVGSDIGFVYSLDVESGCVYWSFKAQGPVRTAISVGRIGARSAIYFGDLMANVYAVDADSGAQIWTARADTHPLARITGAPTLYGDRLYVPVSSLEEATGANPIYQCCTFRGSVVAYDVSDGRQIWKTYTISDAAIPTRKNSQGTQLWGPAGAAIWSAPTIDPKSGVLYVATGDAYVEPAPETTDAVLALDLKTGRIRWVKQLTANDAFVVGCGPTAANRDNCPAEVGPDFDFGVSPILRALGNGKRILFLGQKSGIVWALDPDHSGNVVWQRRVGQGGVLGGIEWGAAADDRLGYAPVSDVLLGASQAGGLHALNLQTGAEVWRAQPPVPTGCEPNDRTCSPAQSAAVSAIPGVVFSGTVNGVMRAYSTKDGSVLWEYNTVRDYQTTNGVPAKGGAINGPGPAIVNGMLFFNSGYSSGGLPGNVLLAFGLE